MIENSVICKLFKTSIYESDDGATQRAVTVTADGWEC